MATAPKTPRSIKKSDTDAPHVIEAPTMEDRKAAAIWLAENTNTVPCFVGPTASGKTYLAHQIAQERDARLITILLQQDTPEEIAGFQAPLGDKLVALTPYWFDQVQDTLNTGRRAVVFFDELGLAHDATRGAIYTFLRDREVRGKYLTCIHSNGEQACSACVIVLAGMNPAELAPPMLSRIAQIPVPMVREDLVAMAQTSLAKRIAQVARIFSDDHPHLSNKLPDPPVIVNKAAIAVVNKFDRTFWSLNEPTRNLIASAILPPAVVEEVMREDSLTTPSVAKQIERPSLIGPIMSALDVPSAVANALALWSDFPNHPLDDILGALGEVQLALYSDEDKLSAFLEAQQDEATTKWWEGLGQEGAEKIAKHLQEQGLFVFDPNKPGGKFVDAMLLQAPPGQNDMVEYMSPEARAIWEEKFAAELAAQEKGA